MSYDWAAERQRHIDEALNKLFAILTPYFGREDCRIITVEYDGMGDSGDATFVSPREVVHEDDRFEISRAIYPLLPSGWEINEGSYGDVTINLETKEIHVYPTIRIEATEAGDTLEYELPSEGTASE
jgi:hypothetical protein